MRPGPDNGFCFVNQYVQNITVSSTFGAVSARLVDPKASIRANSASGAIRLFEVRGKNVRGFCDSLRIRHPVQARAIRAGCGAHFFLNTLLKYDCSS